MTSCELRIVCSHVYFLSNSFWMDTTSNAFVSFSVYFKIDFTFKSWSTKLPPFRHVTSLTYTTSRPVIRAQSFLFWSRWFVSPSLRHTEPKAGTWNQIRCRRCWQSTASAWTSMENQWRRAKRNHLQSFHGLELFWRIVRRSPNCSGRMLWLENNSLKLMNWPVNSNC